MPTINDQGFKLSIIGTPVTIKELTDNKHYAAHVSLKPMVSGDKVEIRLHLMLDATEGEGVKDMGEWIWPITDDEMCYVPWEPPGLKWKLTLTQTAGVVHNYKYIIYEAP